MATRSMRRTTQGGIAWMWRNGEGCVRLRMLASAGSYAGQKEGMCSGKNTCLLSDAGGGVQRNRNGRGQVFAFVSVALTLKRTLGGGGALERGHSAPLERLAQLGYALGGVGAVAVRSNAAERVEGQAAKGRRSVNGR